MDPAYILQILDRELQRVPGFGTHLEATPNVVRAVGVAWNGIAFSRFSTAEAETIIDQEIAHWNSVNRAFEWKVYSHDQPPDLIIRLRKRGVQNWARRSADDLGYRRDPRNPVGDAFESDQGRKSQGRKQNR